VNKAAAGGTAEVEFGRIARQARGAPVVRSSPRMVTDHAAATRSWRHSPAARAWTCRRRSSRRRKRCRDRLSGLSGPDFDALHVGEWSAITRRTSRSSSARPRSPRSGYQGMGGAVAADAARITSAGAAGELGSRARSRSGAGRAARRPRSSVVPRAPTHPPPARTSAAARRRSRKSRRAPASRSATARPGADERRGVWGPVRGPPTSIGAPL